MARGRLTYPGGKNGAGVYQAIINQIPPHRVYVEAFAGSAAVFRHKLPAHTSYLIDIDPAVNLEVAAHLTMRDRASAERPIAAGIGKSDVGGSARHSRRSGPELSPLGKPTDRTRSADAGHPGAIGGATIGRGTDPAGLICIHADAREWLREYAWRGDEFVYLDPPYLAETRLGRHRRIYRFELREKSEHVELLSIIKQIPAPVMISGYGSALYASQLKGWRTLTFTTSTHGGSAEEVLWMNYPEPVALHDYRYLGGTFRQRQDFKRMRERWKGKLAAMPALKRRALLAVLHDQSHGSA